MGKEGITVKKALIYDPYLDTLGGGERYSLSFALGLIKAGYQVDIAWSGDTILKDAENRFGLDLAKINISEAALSIIKQGSLWQKFLLTRKYDLIFWVSDGSLPLLFSSKNLVHFQVPFKKLGGNIVLNAFKSLFINKFIYNSHFTELVLNDKLPKSKSVVLYPPVDIESFTVSKKENIILSVARFDSPSHSKRQDVLIDAFKNFYTSNSNYKLVLAGGSMGNGDVLDSLKKRAGSLPVSFIINPSFDELKEAYSISRFFWHAAGYKINEVECPEQVEHFGMTTVEAISSGCIPLVVNRGGQSEILNDFPLLLCEDMIDFSTQTSKIISQKSGQDDLKQALKKSTGIFSLSEFFKKVLIIAG